MSESDYHSATMQATATLLSVGVAIVAFANWIKLDILIYFILSITVFSLIATSIANHIRLYEINFGRNFRSLKELFDSIYNDLFHFGLFFVVNIFLGMLTVYLLLATKFGGVGT